MSSAASTIDQDEIQNFAKDSSHWWDLDGPFAILHRLNPVRLDYILSHVGDVKGKSILDIGCGGGLVCEPLARLGAQVTGVDADTQAIEIAQAHGEGLDITYINGAAEDLQQQFDIVLALEIIEHVANPALFVQQVSKLVKPGGVVIFSTLNRTAKSFALGIVAAEYITRWVPRGTHDWKKFIKPSELAKMVRPADLTTEDITGLYYKPVEGEFVLSKDHLAVNYFMTAHKEA